MKRNPFFLLVLDDKKSLLDDYAILNGKQHLLIEKLKTSKDSIELINIYYDVIVNYPHERQQILLKAGLQSNLIPRDHVKHSKKKLVP